MTENTVLNLAGFEVKTPGNGDVSPKTPPLVLTPDPEGLQTPQLDSVASTSGTVIMINGAPIAVNSF